jgi:peptidoglycan-associated lipoprotein
MKQYVRLLLTLGCVVLLVFSVSACSKKQVKQEAQTGMPEESDLNAKEFLEPGDIDPALAKIFKDIRFDYDRFSLRPESKKTLDGIAEWLKSNSSYRVLVEGHCDDRGTNEYNLALGERRANSAKAYLSGLGIAEQRISTISYGEEKPLCSEQSEGCWSKNRRDHFLLAKK